jgi:hypothetical protein
LRRDIRRSLHSPLARERSDGKTAIGSLPYESQARETVDVNDHPRASKAQAQKRHEALASCQDFGFVAMLL